MAKRPRPVKWEGIIDDVRVRVYSTRTDLEVIFNDDDIDDPNANVMIYPKMLGFAGAARQGRLEYRP